MEQNLKDALKLITEKCKEPNFNQEVEGKSLAQIVANLRGKLVQYVDTQTIWYVHNVNLKKDPDYPFKDHPDYKLVELSESQRKNAIEELEWLLNDVEACIGHLKNK